MTMMIAKDVLSISFVKDKAFQSLMAFALFVSIHFPLM